MKKTFELTHPKIKYARMVEGVKHDIRRYIKRERKKELPEGTDFWDFDCRFGDTEAEAKVVHLSEIDKYIVDAEERELTSFYVEILAKTAVRTKKKEEGDDDEEEVEPKPLSKLPLRGFGSLPDETPES